MLYLLENLKKHRILKNLTQEDVAEYLTLSLNYKLIAFFLCYLYNKTRK